MTVASQLSDHHVTMVIAQILNINFHVRVTGNVGVSVTSMELAPDPVWFIIPVVDPVRSVGTFVVPLVYVKARICNMERIHIICTGTMYCRCNSQLVYKFPENSRIPLFVLLEVVCQRFELIGI